MSSIHVCANVAEIIGLDLLNISALGPGIEERTMFDNSLLHGSGLDPMWDQGRSRSASTFLQSDLVLH